MHILLNSTLKLINKKLTLQAVSFLVLWAASQILHSGVVDAQSFAPVQIQTAPRIQIRSGDIKLLWALNLQEASGRAKIRSRYEPGFYRRYVRGNKKYAALEARYGARAVSSSYGPWQIMYLTAYEMGYRGEPEALSDARVSLPYVIKYIDFLRKKLKGDERAVISAYNAGPGGVGTNPGYTRKVLSHLAKAPSDWKVHGTS